jgi:hypothetical protein
MKQAILNKPTLIVNRSGTYSIYFASCLVTVDFIISRAPDQLQGPDQSSFDTHSEKNRLNEETGPVNEVKDRKE